MKFLAMIALSQLISFTSFAAAREATPIGYEGKLDVLETALLPIQSGDYALERLEVCGFFRACRYHLQLKGKGEKYSLPLKQKDVSTFDYLVLDLPKERLTMTTLDQKLRLDVIYEQSNFKSFFELVEIPQSCSRSCTGYEPNEVGTSICVSDRETCVPAQEACLKIKKAEIKLQINFIDLKTNQMAGTFVSESEGTVESEKVSVRYCFTSNEQL